MKDMETGSLWSHILGKCMRGDRQGDQLDVIPSTITDFQTWKRLHPKSTISNFRILSFAYVNEYYQGNEKRFLIGIAKGLEARAWRYPDLLKQPVVNDQYADHDLAVFYDLESSTAKIFDRKLDKEVLEFFERDGTVFDLQTESQWDKVSGAATAGPLEGKQLTEITTTVSFAEPWGIFHPTCEYWQPSEEAQSKD